jgi:hypothetical protein
MLRCSGFLPVLIFYEKPVNQTLLQEIIEPFIFQTDKLPLSGPDQATNLPQLPLLK